MTIKVILLLMKSEEESNKILLNNDAEWDLRKKIVKSHMFIRQSLCLGPVRLSYQPYFFSDGTVFFSHNKSLNSTFQLIFSANSVPT
jgi:hypothetical protein